MLKSWLVQDDVPVRMGQFSDRGSLVLKDDKLPIIDQHIVDAFEDMLPIPNRDFVKHVAHHREIHALRIAHRESLQCPHEVGLWLARLLEASDVFDALASIGGIRETRILKGVVGEPAVCHLPRISQRCREPPTSGSEVEDADVLLACAETLRGLHHLSLLRIDLLGARYTGRQEALCGETVEGASLRYPSIRSGYERVLQLPLQVPGDAYDDSLRRIQLGLK